ncbi:hypothetical protein PR048_008403 [Dryococelus australis]|uniref:Chromo domain-containing protein n=1 Tax=Dryococelus australis TaxID=614101 RepID=A0ABQ9HXU2_9NEOP|nr:hypothetical protein PR048_008403 [Dryococelus australis]
MVVKMEIGKDMKKWDVFKAMDAIVSIWRAVQQKTIANCLRHAHFVTPVNEETAVHVFLAAASSKNPDDPPPVDTEPQPGPSTGQQESSGEEYGGSEAEEPAQESTTQDILKAGDVYAAVLRWHGANEEMWSHSTHLREFVEQTLVKKKQTTIKDFFKK